LPSPKRNAAREARIADEIIVDAYSDSERAMGWYYHLDAALRFPFQARCVRQRATSPLRRGEEVTVLAMAPEAECEHEMFVRVRWNDRRLAVPLVQVKPYRAEAGTRQAIEDWHYWVGRGYLL
jgi:hypothetical protein